MSVITLCENNYKTVKPLQNSWVLICFCANWCNACREYEPLFQKVAKTLTDVTCIWVDIENHPILLKDFEVEKFPTILIQKGDIVSFYSCIHPDTDLTVRIVKSFLEKNEEELMDETHLDEEHQTWQKTRNFFTHLKNVL